MANELLDFVMSLVRDPDAAARYAADPAGMLAAANLTGVTSADVDNLIPMVSDSLSTAVPTTGFGAHDSDTNVWTSGAATAAFDAFGADLPSTWSGSSETAGVIDPAAPDLITADADLTPLPSVGDGLSPLGDLDELNDLVDPVDGTAVPLGFEDGLGHAVIDPTEESGFDLF